MSTDFSINFDFNKNECSIAATGPPICEGPRKKPKFLSNSKAEKFGLLLLHIVLFGGLGTGCVKGVWGGQRGCQRLEGLRA